MRCLFIGERDNGCDYHRIVLPAAYMNGAERKLITNDLSVDRLKEGWDVVVLNRGHAEHDAQQIAEWRKEFGFKVVVDTDDYWHLDPSHVLYETYGAGNTAKIVSFLAMADMVTVTHERLEAFVRYINPNVHVMPNSIPFGEMQYTETHRPSKVVRVGWCGSITHDKDMELLRNPMKRFIGRKDMMCVVGGYNNDNIESKLLWDKIVSAFTCGLQIESLILPSQSPWEYMTMYEHMDIVVIPLLQSLFTGMKSNLKVLEAATKKLPVIVPRIHPYLDIPDDIVCYVDRQSDWYKHINRLVNDPYECAARGQLLYDFCREHYSIQNFNRYELYKTML